MLGSTKTYLWVVKFALSRCSLVFLVLHKINIIQRYIYKHLGSTKSKQASHIHFNGLVSWNTRKYCPRQDHTALILDLCNMILTWAIFLGIPFNAIQYYLMIWILKWACSQWSKSRSESRFGSWFWPFPDFKAWFYPLGMQSPFQIKLLKCEKEFLDHYPPTNPDFEDLWMESSLERDSCVRILEMRAEAMHGSISAVGTKYYLAVRRSCSWLGRWLQCLWTHVVQITNPIRKRIAIRNGFWNVIRSFVNRPNDYSELTSLDRTLLGMGSPSL